MLKVEDADDVDGLAKYMHFVRKCFNIQHFTSQPRRKIKKTNPKVNKKQQIESRPFLFLGCRLVWLEGYLFPVIKDPPEKLR